MCHVFRKSAHEIAAALRTLGVDYVNSSNWSLLRWTIARLQFYFLVGDLVIDGVCGCVVLNSLMG